MPLVFDLYTQLTLSAPATTPIVGNVGLLDADGSGRFAVVLPPGDPSLAGLDAWHAAVHGDFVDPITLTATDAVRVRIVD